MLKLLPEHPIFLRNPISGRVFFASGGFYHISGRLKILVCVHNKHKNMSLLENYAKTMLFWYFYPHDEAQHPIRRRHFICL